MESADGESDLDFAAPDVTYTCGIDVGVGNDLLWLVCRMPDVRWYAGSEVSRMNLP